MTECQNRGAVSEYMSFLQNSRMPLDMTPPQNLYFFLGVFVWLLLLF